MMESVTKYFPEERAAQLWEILEQIFMTAYQTDTNEGSLEEANVEAYMVEEEEVAEEVSIHQDNFQEASLATQEVVMIQQNSATQENDSARKCGG